MRSQFAVFWFVNKILIFVEKDVSLYKNMSLLYVLYIFLILINKINASISAPFLSLL